MKKAWYIFILLGCLILICGCSSATKEQQRIYNDDKLIQQEGDSFNFLNRTGETSDTKIEVKFEKFYGAQTIWNIDVSEQGQVKFKFDSDISNGKFKGVLISKENGVTTVFEGSKKGTNMVIVPKGQYRFKIVGDDASGTISIELDLDKDMKSTAV